jgi:oxaloacetate decarboxylase gamma subunit
MDHLSQLFLEAGTLLFAGMVFVFVFLGSLVIFIKTVLARLAIKFPDAVEQLKPQRASKQKSNLAQGISPSIVAAITSAVTQYRQEHTKQSSQHSKSRK